MQAPQPSIPGTRDYAGEDAVVLQMARDAIDATLRRYAYAAIDPPILESPSPFLNRSGEDIRRHMYIFPDPGGCEVCLRPELTIPVCRAYLRQLQSAGGSPKGPGREARLCYFGPAFRYEPASEGGYRQFYQAGAELIGAQRREAADAEILALALDCLEGTGIKETFVAVGDVDVRNAFIDSLPVSERSKTRMRRIVFTSRRQARFISEISTPEAGGSETASEFGELASLLASVEPGKAELLIREIFALADVRHVGGRTPEEIVERLTSRAAHQATEPLSPELIEGIRALLNVHGSPASAFKAIRDHFRAFSIVSIEPVLERCENRLRYFQAYRHIPAALEFNVGLRRDLEYYTGFLFEVYASNLAQPGHLCGGGRYDNLLAGLGANASIPAVGFAIGLDQMLLALQRAQVACSREISAPYALVVATDAIQHEECIGVSVALREAGWLVELDVSGRDEASALSYAAGRNIPCVVFVDSENIKSGDVRLRRLEGSAERLIALSSLRADAKDESTPKQSVRQK